MKSSLLGHVYKTLWHRTLASFCIFHQTLLSTWFLAVPNLVPETGISYHHDSACLSFLSSWKTPVHPLKTLGRHLVFETFSDYPARVHHISLCLFLCTFAIACFCQASVRSLRLENETFKFGLLHPAGD